MSITITKRTLGWAEENLATLQEEVQKIKETNSEKLQTEYEKMVQGLREAHEARVTV